MTTVNITNIDTTAPVITVKNIIDKMSYNEDVIPEVSLSEEAKISMTLNGKAYDGSAITAEGKYVLTVDAVDAAGNKAKTVTLNFTIDKTSPVITISGVEDGKEYTDKVTPKVVTSEQAVVTMTLNGKAYDGSAITAEGKYELTVNAVDAAGNKAKTVTVKFSIAKKVSPTPNNPTNPTTPTTPTNTNGKGGKLPQTGSFMDTNLLLGIGIIFMACGAIFVFKRKRA